jgi:hypothetical protein
MRVDLKQCAPAATAATAAPAAPCSPPQPRRHAPARPSTPQHAPARPSTPQHAPARPSTPQHAPYYTCRTQQRLKERDAELAAERDAHTALAASAAARAIDRDDGDLELADLDAKLSARHSHVIGTGEEDQA